MSKPRILQKFSSKFLIFAIACLAFPMSAFSLTIPPVTQEGMYTCWAAVDLMVMRFFGRPASPPSQCGVVSASYDPAHSCCPLTGTSGCDAPGFTTLESPRYGYVIKVKVLGAIQPSTLSGEIVVGGRPVMTSWRFTGGGPSHMVLCKSINYLGAGNYQVTINDPSPIGGSISMPYTEYTGQVLGNTPRHTVNGSYYRITPPP